MKKRDLKNDDKLWVFNDQKCEIIFCSFHISVQYLLIYNNNNKYNKMVRKLLREHNKANINEISFHETKMYVLG